MRRKQHKLKTIQSLPLNLFLMLLFCGTLILLSPSSAASSTNLDLAMLIDNSQHGDEHSMRWQTTKLLIDRLQSGDRLKYHRSEWRTRSGLDDRNHRQH